MSGPSLFPSLLPAGVAVGIDVGDPLANACRFGDITQDTRLNRYPQAASNRRTFTISAWFKLAEIGGNEYIVSAGDTAGQNEVFGLVVNAQARIQVFNQTGAGVDFNIEAAALLRDVAAWYHVVVAVDTTQATAADRVKMWLNGERVTVFNTESYPAQNFETFWHSKKEHKIGDYVLSANNAMDGYIADLVNVDGQALDETSFGRFSVDTGEWVRADYAGTYGVSGFRMDNADIDHLGKDARAPSGWDATKRSSQWDGNVSGWNFSDGKISTGNSSRAIRRLAQSFSGDFEVRWLYNAGFSPRLGVYDVTEDATFSDTDQNGGMSSMTNSWWVTHTTTASQANVLYGGATQINWTAVADDVMSLRRESGVFSIYQNDTLLHQWTQQFSGAVRIVVATQSTGTLQYDQLEWSDGALINSASLFSSNDTLQADDQVADNPTNNFPVLSPLIVENTSASQVVTISEGGLRADLANTTGAANLFSTMVAHEGKWHFEVNTIALANACAVGICQLEKANRIPGGDNFANGIIQYVAGTPDGDVYDNNAVVKNNTPAGASGGDWIKCEVDLDAGRIEWFDDNDASLGFYDFTPDGKPYVLGYVINDNTTNSAVNFGQQAFQMTPTAGFLALSTGNLETPAVPNGRLEMSVTLRVGTGGATSVILPHAPGLTWVKQRNPTGTRSHRVNNTARGPLLRVLADTAGAESSEATGLTAYNADGYDLGASLGYNENGFNYVDWNWRDAVIPGFAIVTYTGDGQAGRAVPHGLGIEPEYIAVKSLTGARSWQIYHVGISQSVPEEYRLLWDTTLARQQSVTYWNNQRPDATNFYLGTEGNGNQSGEEFVAFVWAPVPGFSYFGSYFGNGNVDGPMVNCGFRPALVHIREVTVANDWIAKDAVRDPINPAAAEIEFNNLAEGSGNFIDLLSNGYKGRATSQKYNRTGGFYMFSAWAQSPIEFARAR